MALIRPINVINWLIHLTERSGIEWQRKEDPKNLGDFYGGCYANFNTGDIRVTVSLDTVQWRGPQQTTVVLSSPGQDKVLIREPLTKLFSLSKYDSQDEAELAQAIQKLNRLAMADHFNRQEKYKANEEERRQKIFHRLLYGEDL